MTVQEIREKFIKYFESKGHVAMPSSSLIPKDDASVLLTTAGMQQFKKWYSGEATPDHRRVVTIQKCVRTGDIEEVGDATHLTFFEMLGNFSFGDQPKHNSAEVGYFKKEAIEWGYGFIHDGLGVADDRIHFSIFKGDAEVPRDDESEKIIKSLGSFKIIECGREDNFWGPTGAEGPCGPTVEIYVDDVEVWNLVFNEYYMQPDKLLLPLPQKGVDTGAGLERVAATLGRVNSVYDTDEFKQITQKITQYAAISDERHVRIMADHLRTATFLLADGVRPSNLDRGYILRRLIRRAVRYGKLSGIEQKFCSEVAKKVVEIYKSNYPNLETERPKILSELDIEEGKFSKVIESGLKKLGEYEDDTKISGKEAFDLFATYGFPLELTQELAKEKGIEVDQAGFEAEFEKHQEVSRAGMEKKFAGGLENKDDPRIIKYHTAAHLMLAALREVLGEQVHQKGSNITAERLRFDFSHDTKMTDSEKQQVEAWVNDKISRALEVQFVEVDVDAAKKAGAEGEFSAKYGEKVKVYSVGGGINSTDAVSKEICGGPHVTNTSELGHFKITKEESSSAGVRRIKAILE
jgi:alanyl-tRNA synthetase